MTITADTTPEEIQELSNETANIIEKAKTSISRIIRQQLDTIREEMSSGGLSEDSYIEDGTSPFNHEAKEMISSGERVISQFNNLKKEAVKCAKKQELKELKELEKALTEKINYLKTRIEGAEQLVANWNNQPFFVVGFIKRDVYYYCPEYDKFRIDLKTYKERLVTVQTLIKFGVGGE